MHRRFPQDQDSREVPREEVHVAGGPAKEVPSLRQVEPGGPASVYTFFDPFLQQVVISFKSTFQRNVTVTPAGQRPAEKLVRNRKTLALRVHVSVCEVSAYCMYCM